MITFDPTPMELLFWEALALIAAACVFAPIFRRLGLGTILGYLAAGLAVQIPFADSIAQHPEELLHFAEFGIVLFLFVIGLELKPSTLWTMRTDIFGLGLGQMLVCGLVLTIPAWLTGLPMSAAIVIGLGLALSSTAMVMQMLDERRDRTSLYGRKSFSILLFQDLAIVPLLLLVAVLAPSGGSMELVDSLIHVGIALAAIAVLALIGRYLLDPMFSLLARTGMQEIMTASALGVVIASALLMDLVGMSYAMGAFIAGVMLAESNYRHEIEANVEPFRGLFLGLFFMAVGLSLDIDATIENWTIIVIAVPALMALKGLAIYGVARLSRLPHDPAVRTAMALPQAGEFGFVLFASAASVGLLDGATSSTLVAIITISMALSPLLPRLEPLLVKPLERETMEETFDDAAGSVMIIGFGRFGQIVSQPLFAEGLGVTILDNDAQRIRDAGRFGFKVHFGDGTRRDVLRAAGAADMSMIVVCVNDPTTANEIVHLVKGTFPNALLYVRSFDRRHSISLMQAEVDLAVRETFESALRLGEDVLIGLGIDPARAEETMRDVRERDLDRLRQQCAGDIKSGMDRLHVTPVRPEPLPQKKAS